MDPTKVEVLKTLYPIFKKEVFERREQLTRIGRRGMTLNLGIILACLIFPINVVTPLLRFYSTMGIAVLTGVMIFQMAQHRRRHIMAKQAVIQIEKALRLFETGFYMTDQPLYPEEWGLYRGEKKELAITSSLLILLAVLAVLTVWSV